MIVWLWDAGPAHGVSDDDGRAREAAEGLMHDGRAASARVEMAVLDSVRALDPGYGRLGRGWMAHPRQDGPVRWVALTDEPAARGETEGSRPGLVRGGTA